MSSVLIAGLGNVFLGDDGFGVEVAQRLRARPLREGVRIEDFGIRGIDLTYALLDGVGAAILVDTTQRGGAPGTLYVIEPEAAASQDDIDPHAMPISPHEMDPGKVLNAVRMLDGACEHILLVGCEPESFGTEGEEEGRMGLSEPVAAAVDGAVALIESLAERLMKGDAVGSYRV